MAEAAVGLGVTLGEASFGALLDIKGSLDSVAKQIARLTELEERYAIAGPVQLALRASAISDASGDTVVLDLGGPSYGRLWEVRRIVVGGVTWSTTVAGTAQVSVAGVRPSSSAPSLVDVVDVATSLPSKAFYSSGQLVLRSPQRLYVAILTPTASTQYVAGAGGFDVPDGPAPRFVSE